MAIRILIKRLIRVKHVLYLNLLCRGSDTKLILRIKNSISLVRKFNNLSSSLKKSLVTIVTKCWACEASHEFISTALIKVALFLTKKLPFFYNTNPKVACDTDLGRICQAFRKSGTFHKGGGKRSNSPGLRRSSS